jgi:cytoskeletal protein CcmA (bactofilin family)
MFWGRKRKRAVTKVETLIGRNTQILGDVRFEGGLHVDGAIKGDVSASDQQCAVLTLSDRGTIEGEVRVPNVVLNGVVLGTVHAAQHIELAANARVEGDVYYGLMEMAMGAEVNGKLVRTAEADKPTLALSHAGPDPTESRPESGLRSLAGASNGKST